MSLDQSLEVAVLNTVTSSTAQTATFAGGIQGMVVTASNDVYMTFDGATATSANGFLVKGGITNNQWEFGGSNVTKINVIAASTSANVSILGIRGRN